MSEEDIEKVWPGLMLHLCSRHRINARNERPTDYKIEDFRKEHYSGYTDSKYFRKLIYELAKLHREIQVDADIIRASRFGLDNCEKYDPTFQRDFKY
jgi:hypothetical protein